MQWSKWFIFLNIFLFCKIIIKFFRIIFGHLFSVDFAGPVSILVFFSILNLFFSIYAGHYYYMYALFIICISTF